MRNVILSVATSLDGFIEGPHGETDWLSFSEETTAVMEEFFDEIDTVFYGRISFEKWGNYMPEGPSGGVFSKLATMKKVVFSATAERLEGNPLIIGSGIGQKVNALKHESGKNIWLYGGASLVTAFINLDLIDEYRIAVFPTILGSGKPLFNGISRRVNLKLNEARTGRSGVIQQRYRRLG